MKKIWSIVKEKWFALKGKTIAAKILTLLGQFMSWAYAAEASIVVFGVSMGIFTSHDFLAAVIVVWGLALILFEWHRKRSDV